MPVIFDYTTTTAYKKGEAKGEARGEAKGEARIRRLDIEKMLTKGKLTPKAIAEMLDVPLDFVLEIEKSL